uniref:hypothetical protein n=1 Tax=Bradyrhizobium sp. (strain ORS 278) TaxID=114615 RepID=UPI0012FEFA90|nr:hypothetical protein [Bradyrhizobium sp. ORS 278]
MLAWFVSTQSNDLRLLRRKKLHESGMPGAVFASPLKLLLRSGQDAEKATESAPAAAHSPSFNASRL